MRTIRSVLSGTWNATLAVLEDIRKALNLEKSVFPFIQQQFFYLLWILVVPAALYLMAQGRELLAGFFDDNTFVAGFRAASLLLVYLLTALTVLMSPWPFFPKKTPADWERVNPFTWKKTGATYVLSVLPSILFYLLTLRVMWPEIPLKGRVLELLTLVFIILLARWFWLKWPKWRVGFWQTWAALLLNMALCWLMITKVIPSWKASEFWNYHWIGFLLGIQVALTAGLARVLRQDLVDQRRRYKWMYLLYFVFTAGYIVVLVFTPNLETVSPIYILLLLSAFYLLVSSLLVAFYHFSNQSNSIEYFVP